MGVKVYWPGDIQVACNIMATGRVQRGYWRQMRCPVRPNPSVNRTACKLRLQVRSGLRPPPAGYVER